MPAPARRLSIDAALRAASAATRSGPVWLAVVEAAAVLPRLVAAAGEAPLRAAVDREQRAGREARRIAREVEDRRRELVRRARATQRERACALRERLVI